ncbi:hypothetical protein N0V90_010651 [Kalmusia sp. IMI 367209]|nr:hypothetical protein N0V90_010651 [Kalmusia sp. IMI 367209]
MKQVLSENFQQLAVGMHAEAAITYDFWSSVEQHDWVEPWFRLPQSGIILVDINIITPVPPILAAHLENIGKLHADTLITWMNTLTCPEEPSLSDLYALLHTLLQQLPPYTPVYCLISDFDPLSVDGVLNSFETVIECLCDLVTANLPAPFKVLLASPTDVTDYIKEQLEAPSLSAFYAHADRPDVQNDSGRSDEVGKMVATTEKG